MKYFIKTTLSIKLSLVFSFFMAVSFTELIINNYMAGRSILNSESTTRFEAIARNLAYNAEYGVLIRNSDALNSLAKSVLQIHDVLGVEIFNIRGEFLVKAGRSQPGSHVVEEPIVTRIVGDGQEAVDSLFGPMSGEEGASVLESGRVEGIGKVRVEFDTSPMLLKLHQMRKHAIALALLSVLLGILLIYIASRFMVAPVKELVVATRRVAEGDLDFHLKGHSGDEIGELAHAFNTMTENLRKSTVSRDYLDTILDSMADGVVVVNPEGNITMVNQGALRMSGFEGVELVNRAVKNLLSLEDNNLMTKKGDAVPVSVSEGTFRSEGGHLKGTVYVVHDMRPIKKLQNRLLQSEKMAAVGQLAAGVSHEINNPLGVILGFAQGLVRRLHQGDPLELPLRSIEREAMRCKDLVQDLLTFSRATHAEKEPLDLNQAVEGALSLVQAQARMEKSEVRKELYPHLPRILGNRNQIQQVMINLANNALDAMPRGGVLSVKTELSEEKPRSWVVLRVSDTGSGIPPEVMSRIFEPFFTTKPVGKGTGLGLSLVYEIVKKHSGSVEVQSRPGLTEFVVRIPARTGRELDEKMKAQKSDKTIETLRGRE